VLGPCLLSVFIDDVDKCAVANTNIKKFTDDIRLWQLIGSNNGREELQQTLDKLPVCEWADI
jgi:hypothetical protein